MLTKRCTTCNEHKEFDQFAKKRQGLQPTCRSCQSIISKKRYQENREIDIKRSMKNKRKRIDKNIENILVYLADHPCVDCGETDPIVLEFDHVEEKVANVSHIMDRSWKRILEEIGRCQVRCANCHKKRTAKQFGWKKAILGKDNNAHEGKAYSKD